MNEAIEAIERAALEDLNAAAGDLAQTLAVHSTVIGTTYASAFGSLPASAIVVNRTIGLGLSGPERRETIDALVAHYADAGVARYFVHVHDGPQAGDLAAWLGAHGLVETRAWMKLARGRAAPPEAETTLDVRPASAADAAAFGRIEADAFDVGEAGAPLLARLVGRPGWHVYMSFDGDEAAGAGALYVDGDVAWCDWGATAPSFRGRGGQSAILRRRILDALDLGCRVIATETGEEVPGEPQISYRNIVKMGFEPAYTRRNYALPKPG